DGSTPLASADQETSNQETSTSPVTATEEDRNIEGSEQGAVLVKSEITNGVDPSKAITVRHLDIPLDQLSLLVRPLTLVELEVEAAAWFVILRQKIQQISETEIAIKLENQATAEEEHAKRLLEAARADILSAEKKFDGNGPNTDAYRAALKDLQRGKDELYSAEDAVRVAIGTMREFHDDPLLEREFEAAKTTQRLAAAQRVLEQATEERSQQKVSSDAYKGLTEKINSLERSFLKRKELERRLRDTVPQSAAYLSLEEAITQIESRIFEASLGLFRKGLLPASRDRNIIAGEGDAMRILNQIERELSDVERFVQEEVQTDKKGAGEAIATQLDRVFDELEEATEIQRALKEQLLRNVAALQEEEIRIVDRLRVVLDELDRKGGDTETYRVYISAANQLEFDLTDTQALQVRIETWLKSEEGGVRVGINLLTVVSILFASWIAAIVLSRAVERLLGRMDGLSALLRDFAVITIYRGTLALGAAMALISMGVSLGPVLALFGGISFVLAFALQSNLGNFASGLMLLINKPFDVGDEIKIGSHLAFVQAISLVNTTLRDASGNIISLPNNTVWQGDIINYTHAQHRRLYFQLSLPFDQDLDEVREMWFAIAKEHPDILNDPGPSFTCPWTAYYEHAITAELRAWCTKPDYRPIYLSTLQRLQEQIQKRGIKLAPPLLRVTQ
ncbi:MAG: mechanosensitive ion channel domain-containing protein, partial [Cyanobacteria bacterium P01_F01_bin.153]